MLKQRASDVSIPDFPALHLLDRPFKLDEVMKVPERELAKWYDHMDKGKDISENRIILSYKVGKRNFDFILESKRLLGPDGQPIPGLEPIVDRDPHQHFSNEQVVANRLKKQFANGKIILANIGISSDDYIQEMVTKQWAAIRQYGVERHGTFRKIPFGLVHNDSRSEVEVIMDLGKVGRDNSGNIVPNFTLKMRSISEPNGDLFADYHTHPNPSDIHPSAADIVFMRSKGQTSMLIGTKSSDDSFAIHEWKLKMQNEAGLPGGKTTNELLARYISTGNPGEILGLFEHKEAILRRNGGKTTIAPR